MPETLATPEIRPASDRFETPQAIDLSIFLPPWAYKMPGIFFWAYKMPGIFFLDLGVVKDEFDNGNFRGVMARQ
jgi:hypothetical protein